MKLKRDSERLYDLEKVFNEYKEKTTLKIKKHKRKHENGVGKVTMKTSEIESNVKSIYSMVIKLNKQVHHPDGEVDVGNENMENALVPLDNNMVNFSSNNNGIEEIKNEFRDKLDQLKYRNKIMDEDIIKIKKFLTAMNSQKNSETENNVVFDFKDTSPVSSEELEEIKESLKNLIKGESYILNQINFKVGKDDLEKSHKSMIFELDKLVLLIQ